MDIWGPLSLAGYPWLAYSSQVQHKKERFHEPRMLERTAASWQEVEIETQAWKRETGVTRASAPSDRLSGGGALEARAVWREKGVPRAACPSA